MTIAQWIQITFLNDFVTQINSRTISQDQSSFTPFQNLGDQTLQFQRFQSLLIFMTFCKLLIFFILPKHTSIIIEVFFMASTYVIFFMTLYFLV